jgi:hypothetical protein
MIDITSNGVNFALLQGQLLTGDINRTAFLERAGDNFKTYVEVV